MRQISGRETVAALLLAACALLLGGQLIAWLLLQYETPTHDVLAAIVFLASWGVFILGGVMANRIRIKKKRKKKLVPAPAAE